MFHRVEKVSALPDYLLNVRFVGGATKLYDVKPLFAHPALGPSFKALANMPGLFAHVQVDVGGFGIIWNDELDLSCNDLFANGKAVHAAQS